jgi:hypothetical protein
MKNLLIGGFTNYSCKQLIPWVLSAREFLPDSDICLAVGDTDSYTKKFLQDNEVIIAPYYNAQNVPPHVSRFLSIFNYLNINWEKYKYVITTDVRDVVFQSDPFVIMNDRLLNSSFKLLIATEGLRYKDEAWGKSNFSQTFGSDFFELFKDKEIFNVGTFGGFADHVKDIILHIYIGCLNRPNPICDQAVFNLLVATQPYKEICLRTEDWACEAGTVADPSKISNFRPNLLCQEPIFHSNFVYSQRNFLFPIVHQYDRVPAWSEAIINRYY